MKKIIILSLSLSALAACGNHSDRGDSDQKAFMVEGNRITVAEKSPILSNIKVRPVETAGYQATFSTSCEARPIPSQYAEIASPFAGRVVRSFVRLGQKVSAGSPVFEISSPSFFEAEKICYQARQEMELAQKNLNRERDLLANNVGAVKNVEEAETNYRLKKEDYEHALASINVYRHNHDAEQSAKTLIVRSPIAGEVVKNKIVIGQYIKEDAEALALVADLDKVWVVAYIKEKDIPRIRNIETVKVNLSALPDTPIEGKIYYASELLDEETRSVEIVIECDNRERLMKPFMYGTVNFTASQAQAAVVPNSAVLQGEESRYVIVSEGANRFRKANIAIASVEGDRTFLLSGVSAGEQIVAEGALYFIDAK